MEIKEKFSSFFLILILINKRRGFPFIFITRVPPGRDRLEFQSCLSANHLFSDQNLKIKYAVNGGEDKKSCAVRTTLFRGDKALKKSEKSVNLIKGMNLFSLNFSLTDADTGLYLVKNEFCCGQAELQTSLSEKEKIFVLNKEWLNSLEEEIKNFYKSSQLKHPFKESIPVVEIRYQWIEQFMREAAPYSSIEELPVWFKELTFLADKLKRGEPALFDSPGIHRYAHRSKIDNTLQPYSLFIPSALKSDKAYPLLVALHGSGVDERGMIRHYSRIFSDWLILAPQARGLSAWYLGKSGEDVLECIEHVSRLFPIDKDNIFLLGFSMGGYGVWRIGLLHPEIFKALVVISGDFQPPAYIKGENMLEFLARAKGKSILIVHGVLDNAVPVDKVQKGINRMKELSLDFDYWEIERAAHGNFKPEVWQRIKKWIKQKLVH